MRTPLRVAVAFIVLAALAPGLIAVIQPSLTSCGSIEGLNPAAFPEPFSTLPSTTPVNTLRLANMVLQDPRFIAREKGSCFEYAGGYESGPVVASNLATLVFYHYGNQTWRPCGVGPPIRVILDGLQARIPIVAGGFDEKALEISDVSPPFVWNCPPMASP